MYDLTMAAVRTDKRRDGGNIDLAHGRTERRQFDDMTAHVRFYARAAVLYL